MAALLAGEDARATALAEALDAALFRSYWTSAGERWEQLHRPDLHTKPTEAPRSRRVSDAVFREVVTRDRWHCRYCGLRLISPELRRALNRRLLDVLPWGPTDATKHFALFVPQVTLDHVHAHWAGGTDESDNLVSACGVCNFQKGSCSLDELDLADPFDRAPVDDGWETFAGMW